MPLIRLPNLASRCSPPHYLHHPYHHYIIDICTNTMGPPSIQSYFSKSSSPSKRTDSSPVRSSSPTKGGSLLSSSPSRPISAGSWVPEVDYREVDIEALVPGPQCVLLVGRIANFYDQSTPSKMPKAARGCIKMIVKDDTGALTVRDNT